MKQGANIVILFTLFEMCPLFCSQDHYLSMLKQTWHLKVCPNMVKQFKPAFVTAWPMGYCASETLFTEGKSWGLHRTVKLLLLLLPLLLLLNRLTWCRSNYLELCQHSCEAESEVCKIGWHFCNQIIYFKQKFSFVTSCCSLYSQALLPWLIETAATNQSSSCFNGRDACSMTCSQ